MVARGRFELPSEDPEPSMIDHYTTGLSIVSLLKESSFLINKSLTADFQKETGLKRGFLYVLLHLM